MIIRQVRIRSLWVMQTLCLAGRARRGTVAGGTAPVHLVVHVHNMEGQAHGNDHGRSGVTQTAAHAFHIH